MQYVERMLISRSINKIAGELSFLNDVPITDDFISYEDLLEAMSKDITELYLTIKNERIRREEMMKQENDI